jgi:hypothetical protein
VQSFYPETFERDMACTEPEWLGWLPAALGDHPWQQDGPRVHVTVGAGTLALAWQAAPPRVIALMRMPRLLVRFQFAGLDEAARYTFMKRFDLYMQRGGG